MRRTTRTLTAAVLGAALIGTAATVAEAHDGLCDLGYSCVYQDLNYGGSLYGSAKNSVTFWGSLTWNDKATSVSANGKQCRQTRYYEHAADSKGVLNGAYLTLNSRHWSSSNYRDGDLRDGAGSVKTNWNDRISGFQHWGC